MLCVLRKMAFYLFNFSIFILICSTLAEDQLLFVNILYRHGDRTPLLFYPNDPYKDESLWPNPSGQLTNLGKREHYDLGVWLRKRYDGFLPKSYSPNDIYVQSIDIDRCLMSAEVNLAGLYAPVDSDVWNEDLKWLPIPVHTVPKKVDMISGSKKCRKFEKLLNAVLQSPEYQSINRTLKSHYDYVTNRTGMNFNTFEQMGHLFDTLSIEESCNFSLPPWTGKVYPEILSHCQLLNTISKSHTIEMRRLKVGLLLNEMLERFVAKTKGTLKPNRKMWMYSVHDSNLAKLLITFGDFNFIHPPYASALLLELWYSKSENHHYVSIFYKNDTLAHPIRISGCDFKCDLKKMQEILTPVLIEADAWEKECNMEL